MLPWQNGKMASTGKTAKEHLAVEQGRILTDRKTGGSYDALA
jgi:hypothetical protein